MQVVCASALSDLMILENTIPHPMDKVPVECRVTRKYSQGNHDLLLLGLLHLCHFRRTCLPSCSKNLGCVKHGLHILHYVKTCSGRSDSSDSSVLAFSSYHWLCLSCGQSGLRQAERPCHSIACNYLSSETKQPVMCTCARLHGQIDRFCNRQIDR